VGEDGVTEDVRHGLYELCVQSTRHLVPFLRAVHGQDPRVLGEDFAGTAALSHHWVGDVTDGRAVAVDLDAAALGYRAPDDRVSVHLADVCDVAEPADVVFVGNFSIGYRRTRADLVAYLRHVRSRLNPGGVFVCDTYGGESAFLIGEVHRDHWITGENLPEALAPHHGKRVRYTWEQRDADPATGLVTDICHFRIVDAGGTIDLELLDAFVYEWRLWSIPELRDALIEAGFDSTEVYAKTADAVDAEGNVYVRPIDDGGEELDESFIVLVAARR
jgi:SAM-dependent methyltransferase